MREDFIVFGAPQIEEEEIREVVDSLRSGWIGTGPRVARFEDAFRAYRGAKYAVAVNSCTAALHVSMVAAGIRPGDEVITTPLTFAATANAVIHVGGTPVFVDVRRETQNIDPDRIRDFLRHACTRERKTGIPVNRRTHRRIRALLPVHFAGRPCEMEALREIAEEYHLVLIEDAAHAIEAEYHGRKIGTIGDIACFSFYVTKNVITGEGGMVLTEDEELASRIKIYALHGLSKDAWKRYSDEGFKHYEVLYPGFKYNMMDLQAAIGIHQLARVEQNWRRREEIWRRYDEAFHELPVHVPSEPAPDTRHARHLYTILVDDTRTSVTREEFQRRLHEAGIGTGVHYVALHLHPYYQQSLGYRCGDFAEAEFISNRTLSLPLSPKLSDDDVARIIRAVQRILA